MVKKSKPGIQESVSVLYLLRLGKNSPWNIFLKNGRIRVSDVTILDTPYLIPFKAKAWIDLSDRKAAGEIVDSKNIRKHKNDVFRLTELLDKNQEPLNDMPAAVRENMQTFFERMEAEEVDPKQLGIRGKTKESILDQLRGIYR